MKTYRKPFVKVINVKETILAGSGSDNIDVNSNTHITGAQRSKDNIWGFDEE